VIGRDIYAEGDEQLLTILMDNLLSNAWKYTSKATNTFIEFGHQEVSNERVYFVKDNGVGFDTRYATKIFEVFQRLHSNEFEGTGIGLATVKRIINRHSGRIWADSQPDRGSTFFFTLGTETS
jgi:light-regulated signal transduction histidine kinase (bacteriophytochrome)